MKIISTQQSLHRPSAAGSARPAADAAAPAGRVVAERVVAERVVAERVVEGEVLGRARPGAASLPGAGFSAAPAHGLAAYLAQAAFGQSERDRPHDRVDCYA